MRDRLVEMIQNSVGGCAKHWAEIIADNLLDNGVIVPPVKVGDLAYKPIIIDDPKRPAIQTIVVNHINVYINNHGVSPYSFVVGKLKNTICGASFDFDEIGKTVFLTKKEAEKTLAKMKGGE